MVMTYLWGKGKDCCKQSGAIPKVHIVLTEICSTGHNKQSQEFFLKIMLRLVLLWMVHIHVMLKFWVVSNIVISDISL